jgi:hypothetical protein
VVKNSSPGLVCQSCIQMDGATVARAAAL